VSSFSLQRVCIDPRAIIGGAAGAVFDAVLKRDLEHISERDFLVDEELFERDIPEFEARSFGDDDSLEARYFDSDDLDARSLEEWSELATRSLALETRSWDFEDEI